MTKIYPDNFIEALTIADNSSCSKKVFIELSRSKITYGETCILIRKLTALYQEWGLKPGDHVVFSTKNDIHAAILFISLLVNGITAVIIDPDTKKTRANHLLEVSQPQGIILDTEIHAEWQIDNIQHVLKIDTSKRSNFFNRLLKSTTPETNNTTYPSILSKYEPAKITNPTNPDLDAYILFTSGTTSDPKGVRISYKALITHLETLSYQYRYDQGSRILNILNFSHADGIIQGPIITFFNNAQLFRPINFSIQLIPELLDAVYHYRITNFVTVPTVLSLIMKFAAEQKDSFQTDDFQFIISCGALLESELWERFEKTFNTRITNVFGLTETVIGGLFSGPDDETHKIGTIGKPIDCEAKIIDKNGNNASTNEPGELLIRGDNVMSGYLNSPKQTAEVFNDGWFCTGDIATCDPQGFYRIAGRKKSIIISRGVNIHPEEITEVLHRHPGVIQAVTFGLKDEIFGERIISAVSVRDSEVTDNTLVTFCREYLEEVKIPDKILILSTLPRGRSEKILIEAAREIVIGEATKKDQKLDSLTKDILDVASNCFKVPVELLSLNSTPESVVGWDSLALLSFVTQLEKRFGLELEPNEIMKIDSLHSVKNIIENKLHKN